MKYVKLSQDISSNKYYFRKMKIGIVCYPTFGGSGVVATELGLALANKGHKVHFITYTQPVRLKVFSPGVYYHEVRPLKYDLFEHTPYEIALASKLVDVCQHEHLDILHVHYAIPHAAAAYFAKQILVSKGLNIPVVTSLHGTDITLVGKDDSYGPVVEFSINHSDGVSTVSESLRIDTLAAFEIKKDIEVIPNFIDFNRFKKSNKEHFKKAICPENEKLIIHVSNFRKVKRIPDIIKVFKRVREHLPVKMLLIGDGPERHKAENLCRELGTCDDIRFLGKQNAIEELMAIGDVFILPSEKESFGLAALEAMACEIPVIASNTGGLPEIIKHGTCGYLSPVGDIESMSNNMTKLLENNERLNTFKENALNRAKDFSLERILPLYEAFYEKIMRLNS